MKIKLVLLTILFSAGACLTVTAPAKASEANLAIASPSAGQIWVPGSAATIAWSPNNPPVTAVGQAAPTVYIDLNSVSSCGSAAATPCPDASSTPYIIAQNVPDTGIYYWAVPSTIYLTYQGPMTVTVGLSNSSAQGTSSQFYIVAPNPYFSSSPLSAPNGGQQWAIGSSDGISWTSASSTASGVNIYLVPVSLASCSANSATPCGTTATSTAYEIASNAPNTGSYSWNINNSVNGQPLNPGSYIISIADPDTGNVIASSAGAFTLTGLGQQANQQTAPASSTPPQISGINPNSGNIGQVVNVIGSGFAPTGNSVQFGANSYINNLNSTNGLSVQFTVPAYMQPCPPNQPGACPLAVAIITPGAYGISVSNAYGTSNTLPFEVTGGQGLTTPPPSGSTAPPTTGTGFPDGALVMAVGNPTVYLVSGGQFQPFSSAAIFLAGGYQWPEVQSIPPAQLNPQYINPVPVPAPNGSIIKTPNNPTVYLIVNGQKSAIPSLNVFNSLGLNLKNLITVSDAELQNYPAAPAQT